VAHRAGKLLKEPHLDNPPRWRNIFLLLFSDSSFAAFKRVRTDADNSIEFGKFPHCMERKRFTNGGDVIRGGDTTSFEIAFLTVGRTARIVCGWRGRNIINHRIDEAARLAVAAFVSHAEMCRQKQARSTCLSDACLRTPLNAVSLLVEESSACPITPRCSKTLDFPRSRIAICNGAAS